MKLAAQIGTLIQVCRGAQLGKSEGSSASPSKQLVNPLVGQEPAPNIAWTPTHQHRKGGLYRVLGHGTLEADRSPATIYDDADGTIWIRPTAEFVDGRFTALPVGSDSE